MRFRKILLGAAAAALPLTAISTLALTSTASAAGKSGTGNYSCTKVGGTIKFSPPLTTSGGKAEKTTITTSASKCTGGSPVPKTVKGKATVTSSSNSCGNLANSQTLSFKLSYTPSAGSSTFTGTSSSSGTTFNVTGSVTGAYPSSSAQASVAIKQSAGSIAKACGSKKGLKSLTIKSGSLTNF